MFIEETRYKICNVYVYVYPVCNPGRCECPSARPRWDGEECLTELECGGNDIVGFILHFVPSIAKYTNGCTQCQCGSDGLPTTDCIPDPNQEGDGCIIGSLSVHNVSNVKTQRRWFILNVVVRINM